MEISKVKLSMHAAVDGLRKLAYDGGKGINMTWMKKRIGSILFILALCLATMLTVAWADESDLTYNGSAQSPTIEVKLGETTLVQDIDFTVTGNTQTNAGTYELTITGKGNYRGNQGQHDFQTG